jgi:hypothetical protein
MDLTHRPAWNIDQNNITALCQATMKNASAARCSTFFDVVLPRNETRSQSEFLLTELTTLTMFFVLVITAAVSAPCEKNCNEKYIYRHSVAPYELQV